MHAPANRSLHSSGEGDKQGGGPPCFAFFWVLFLATQEKYQRSLVLGQGTAPRFPVTLRLWATRSKPYDCGKTRPSPRVDPSGFPLRSRLTPLPITPQALPDHASARSRPGREVALREKCRAACGVACFFVSAAPLLPCSRALRASGLFHVKHPLRRKRC